MFTYFFVIFEVHYMVSRYDVYLNIAKYKIGYNLALTKDSYISCSRSIVYLAIVNMVD